MRLSAASILGEIGAAAKDAVPELICALHSDVGPFREAVVEAALGNIGPAANEAIPALRYALQDNDQDFRNAAKKALDEIEKR